MNGGEVGRDLASAAARLSTQADAAEPPRRGCRRHADHLAGCKDCAQSFIDGVAWYLTHPDEIPQSERRQPRLDPTPCGVCGAVIGEGLMELHMNACRPRDVAHFDGSRAETSGQ